MARHWTFGPLGVRYNILRTVETKIISNIRPGAANKGEVFELTNAL